MTAALPTLAALHARLMLQARDAEAIAARAGEHAEREAATAARLRAEAAALADVLAPLGVHVPDPRQLSLLSDGIAHVERAARAQAAALGGVCDD